MQFRLHDQQESTTGPKHAPVLSPGRNLRMIKLLIQLIAATAFSAAALGVGAADTGTYLAALEIAAGQGDPKAQTELATRYENAEDVPRDREKARLLYCRAAKQGYAEAQFQLGWIYANGRGVAHDDGVAAALFGAAASQGHEYAAKLLRYVHPRPDTRLPACLTPDPPAVAKVVDAEAVVRGRADVEQLVHRLAPEYRIDPNLALALIAVESAFNDAAISPKNAQGLMQLIPQTAERFGVKRPLDAAENVKGGLAYLRWLLAYFRGDVRLVVAAYNAGEAAVEKHRGIPPYPETRTYVKKVTAIYKRAHLPFDPDVVGPSPMVRRARASRP